MNCSCNYQAAGHRRRALTQPPAVLGGRRRQTGDSAGVTPQVLLLRRRGNVPHLHRRVAAEDGRSDEERRQKSTEAERWGLVQLNVEQKGFEAA